MRTVRQGLVVAIALSTVAFTSTAMAGKNGVPGPNQNAPGQVFKSERNDPLAAPGQRCPRDRTGRLGKAIRLRSALSPGQQFKRSLGTPAQPIPGSLP